MSSSIQQLVSYTRKRHSRTGSKYRFAGTVRGRLQDSMVRFRERAQDYRSELRRKHRGWCGGIDPPPRSAVCDLCGAGPKTKNLSLDHCHKTNTFRGWLCTPCNTAIGRFGDDIAGLERALSYLQRSKA